EGGLPLARQRRDIFILQHAHAVTDALRAEFLDGFADVFRGSPFARVDGGVQARLFCLLEDAVERLGGELRFIASQVERHDSDLKAVCRSRVSAVTFSSSSTRTP